MKSKIVRGLIIGLCLFSLNLVPAMANDSLTSNETNTTESSRYVETGYKYMKINGVCYRRLWNYTEGVWVDPEWTPCPASSHNH